jgi:very-short-patch-repair endonuclease
MQDSIEQLESLFAERGQDANVLRALLAELAHRRTDRGIRLEHLVRDRVAATEPGGQGNRHRDDHPSMGTVAAVQMAARSAWSADGTNDPPPSRDDQPLLELLERMRLRLLDLTAKNRLLNYRHPKGSSLRIVDEAPAQVFEFLTGGKAMLFEPISAPPQGEDGGESESLSDAIDAGELARELSSRERRVRRDRSALSEAQRHGIDPSFDLQPVGATARPEHQDSRLQTLLFPDDLEERLRKIGQEWSTALQETGANKLHLMFGFLEWHDVPEAQVTEKDLRGAPLVLVPVALTRLELDRATRTFRYTVAASGEDWGVNITLQEKARREFGVDVPDMKTGDEQESLEDYFRRVESVLEAAPRGWRLRRQVTLGLVSFGKQLMWRDLDPRAWPTIRGLLTNTLLRQVLGEAGHEGDDSAVLIRDEYLVDDLPAELRPAPPTVMDADSSQHSVLVDALRGRSLVVQGPPGTGKSQTIANLVGAALLAGKRVLFMAEKKAALDVVHRRLTEIGLGDFCLALHSHSSQKRAFLEDLTSRMKLRGQVRAPSNLANFEAQLADHRAILNGHPGRLHRSVTKVDKSPFELLWTARNLLDQLADDLQHAIRKVRVAGISAIDERDLKQAVAVAEDFGAAAAAVIGTGAKLSDHPWSAIERVRIPAGELDTLVDSVRALRNAVGVLLEHHDRLRRLAGVPVTPSTRVLADFAAAINDLPALAAEVPADLPSRVIAASSDTDISRLLNEVGALHAAWDAIPEPWGRPTPLAADRAQDFTAALEQARRHVGGRTTHSAIGELRHRLVRSIPLLERITSRSLRLGAILEIQGPISLMAAEAMTDVANASSRLDDAAFSLRSDALREPSARTALRDLVQRAEVLKESRRDLEDRYPGMMRPSIDEIATALRNLASAPRVLPWLFSAKFRAASRMYRAMAGGKSAPREAMLAAFRSVVRQASDEHLFGSSEPLIRLFGAHSKGIDTAFGHATALHYLAEAAAGTVDRSAEASTLLVDRVWELSSPSWRAAHREAANGADDLREINELRQELESILSALGQPLEPLRGGLEELCRHMVEHEVALGAVPPIAEEAQAAGDATLDDLRARVDAVLAAWRRTQALMRHQALLQQLGFASLGDRGSLTRATEANRFVSSVRRLDIPPEVRAWLCDADAHSRVEELKSICSEISDAVAKCRDEFAAVEQLAEVRWSRWASGEEGKAEDGSDVARLPRLKWSLDHALAAEAGVYSWATLRRARHDMEAVNLAEVATLVERGTLAPQAASLAAEAALYNTLANHVLRADPALAQFAGDTHSQAMRRFVDLDNQVMLELRAHLRYKLALSPGVPGVGYGPVAALTEESLISYQAERSRPRITIRGLFARAGRAIQTMKPCFMMGPQSVAQYLAPGRFQFDIVVMDEASQLRPEDALGAIARASQMIVVGDPMQLGPTNFFDKQGDEDDDAELPDEDGAASLTGPTVLERSESILLAASTRYPTRMLRWHYRSRHPKLIAFSNREFYHSELVVFPSPGAIRVEDGLFYNDVADGIYLDNTNMVEAQAVVEAVCRHAREYPSRTLVVVTLNYYQRDLILGLLVRAEKEDTDLAAFRRRHEGGPEPLDVKNLENVQGDERDVVMVSITFGRGPGGQLLQNFGPINKVGGERRLNVLFTRAKHRLDVFCSFNPADLRVDEKAPRGVQVLKDYLRYAQDGEWAAGRLDSRPPDSAFELAVGRALEGHGLRVDLQIGVAGYFVDLAIVHPAHPGAYVLGVECDGATYHSAKSARDRDRLRQQVLENLGWRIHRIWSTDWFRDPVGQAARVAARVSELLEGTNQT